MGEGQGVSYSGFVQEVMRPKLPAPMGVIDPVVPADAHQVQGVHYLHMTVTPWQVIEANGMDYWEGNALKYLMRWRRKNGIPDLRKCIHYLEKLIEREEQGLGLKP